MIHVTESNSFYELNVLNSLFPLWGNLQKNDKHSLELLEVPVKDLTYDQLQMLKVCWYDTLEHPVKEFTFLFCMLLVFI